MSKIKKVLKPWGYELIWAQTDCYAGKILVIHKGERLSYQYHRRKEETIFLLKGLLRFEYATAKGRKRVKKMKVGDRFHIPPQLRHRMEALETSEVLEVSTPEVKDVVRLEDDYRRIG